MIHQTLLIQPILRHLPTHLPSRARVLMVTKILGIEDTDDETVNGSTRMVWRSRPLAQE
jgi:hypothetical protein